MIKKKVILALVATTLFSGVASASASSCLELSHSLMTTNSSLKSQVSKLEDEKNRLLIKNIDETQKLRFEVEKYREMASQEKALKEELINQQSAVLRIKEDIEKDVVAQTALNNSLRDSLSKLTGSSIETHETGERVTIQTSYSSPSDISGIVALGDGLSSMFIDGGNVRATPSTASRVLEVKAKNSFVKLTHKTKDGTWFKIDGSGWVYKTLVVIPD